MKVKIQVSFVLALMMLAALASVAGGMPQSSSPSLRMDGEWQGRGPFGGDVISLGVQPGSGYLFAGLQSGGLYRSTDGGETWQKLGSNLPPDGSPHALAFARLEDASSVDYIFAAVGSRVYISMDGGNEWQITYSEPADAQVWALAADEFIADSPKVFAATESGRVLVWSGSGDLGSWMQLGDPFGAVTALALFHDDEDYMLYAAIQDAGDGDKSKVAVRTNPHSGSSVWQIRSGVLPLDSNGKKVRAASLAVSPADHDVLILGQGYLHSVNVQDTRGSTYRSTDGGDTWGSLFGFSLESWALLFSSGGKLYCGTRSGGVYASQDAGATWSIQNPGAGFSNWILSLELDESGILYAGSKGPGVFAAGGMDQPAWTWSLKSRGLQGIDPNAVVVDPADPLRAYVATDGSGNFGTADGGLTWELLDIPGGWTFGTSLLVLPGDTGQVLVGLPNRVALSEDKGETWDEETLMGDVQAGLENPSVDALAFIPGSPAVYAAMYHSLTRKTSVWRRSEPGSAWVQLDGNAAILEGKRVEGLAAFELEGNSVLMLAMRGTSTNAPGYALRSMDGGQTWQDVSAGLESTPGGAVPWVRNVHWLNGRLWAALNDGIAWSGDGGATWERLAQAFPRVYGLEADPHSSTTLYAATDDGLYKTVDAGVSWTPVDGMQSLVVEGVAGVPDGQHMRLYCATRGGFFSAPGQAANRAGQSFRPAGVYALLVERTLSFLPIARLVAAP